MARTVSRSVVVGLDGSRRAQAAVELAAAEAVLRGVRLEVVVGIPAGDSAGEAALGRARRVVGATVERVRASWPELAVSSMIRRGDPVQTLIEATRGAELAVVGSDGGLSGTGAPGAQCTGVAAHAFCPTLVVPPEADLGAALPVMLGAFAGPGEERAIEFAFEEAALRAVPLRVVQV